MLKILISYIQNIDNQIAKIISKTFELSLILSVISVYILYLYITYPFSFNLLNSSLLLFKASVSFIVSGFMCGFATNAIINRH